MEEEKTPSRSILEAQLLDAIRDSLSNYMTPNATFLAERLLNEHDSEENRSILAECYINENKIYKAYHILQNCKSDENRFKLAVACVRMNKLKEAEKALLGPNLYDFLSSKINNGNINNVPNGSYGVYLLGLINEKQQKFQEAKEYYFKSLEINPTLWVAYEKLCRLGDHILPNKVFSEAKFKIYENNRKKNVGSLNLIDNQVVKSSGVKGQGKRMAEKAGNLNGIDSGLIDAGTHEFDVEGGAVNRPKTVNLIKSMNFGSVGENVFSVPNLGKSTQLQKSYTKEKESSHLIKKNSSKNDNLELKPSISSFPLNSSISLDSANSFKDLITMLKRFAEPFYNMSHYLCAEAIEIFSKLPSAHLNSGWVLSNIAKCYMECIKYSEAEKYFSEALKVEPHRLEGIEYYSSCLWHLKKQVELCALAHDALEKSRYAPESWIAAGNCFSLQKEHENALKFFNRAIQLNPQNAYAHSLCGHEYVYNEDFQNARRHFETSLSFDIRHYNAWWGLGNINYKQEKYEKALENFHRAISINANCSVLYSYLGMTLTSMRRFGEALKHFDKSENLDPNNVLNRFQKASVLVQLEKYEQALAELEKLRLMMPKEAPIPILMGKIYKKLNKIDRAHLFFNLALDLEPKDTQRIKSLIDSLQNNNEFNEDLEFF